MSYTNTEDSPKYGGEFMFKDLNDAEEAEFRKWARDNYEPYDYIKPLWHPVVKDECDKINTEYEKSINLG